MIIVINCISPAPSEGLLGIYKLLHSGLTVCLHCEGGSLDPDIGGSGGICEAACSNVGTSSSLMKTHMTSLRIYESDKDQPTHAVAYHPLQAKHHCYR